MRKKLIFCFLGFIFILLMVVICYYKQPKQESEVKSNFLRDLTNLSIEEVQKYADDYHILLDISYQYHSNILEGKVISQNLEEGTIITNDLPLEVVVSRGKIPVEMYQNYQVNELGKVPIMMYHGIINQSNSQTNYIGGNVDKDGYNRTVEAFRNDLEFYYQEGYRMIRLSDYVDGVVQVDLGKSPIILTFDDGNENNFRVLGEENGELLIDPNCAVGVLEEFKKKYPDYGVTATFFVNSGLFGQEKYNEKILNWLVENGYDIGNHTMTHVDFTKIGKEETMKEVGGLYQILEKVIPNRYVSIVALPFGSPYRWDHNNYEFILKGIYEEKEYITKACLRVGWEASESCFDNQFNPFFLKRIRAYDNDGDEFDIEMNFEILEKERYISDGDEKTIVVLEEDKEKVRNIENMEVISY